MDLLIWLQNWNQNHCDGDWEHLYGVKIDTLDNCTLHFKYCTFIDKVRTADFTTTKRLREKDPFFGRQNMTSLQEF